MQKLPICIQTFETIRKHGYLYVDKTRHIWQMINEGMFYFLSRPRRFGKSLLVSTLMSFFQAEKDLFEGLWISEHGDFEWEAHPVILMDFNEIPHSTPEKFEQAISLNLNLVAKSYGISLETAFIETQLQELISELKRQTGEKVVILVDEYDTPITEHIGKGKTGLENARANWNILRSFLGVLKGGRVSSLLRFVFVTGISRFSNISIFSEIGHLNDMTLSKSYADMLGYTQEELEDYFEAHMVQLSQESEMSHEAVREKLTCQYRGYRFSEKDIRVYNPFSVLMAFGHMNFKNHWADTGSPAFAISLLREREYDMPTLENLEVDEQMFSHYEIGNLQPEAILFQTGYMTIKAVNDTLYALDYPNQEAKTAFLKHMLFSLTQENREDRSAFMKLAQFLEKEDFTAFFETMTAIFASVPPPADMPPDQAHFHTLFYLMVSASGVNAQSELLTIQDLVDIVVTFPDKIFVMEFRCDQSADAAIMQIREKGYAERYKQSGKKLFLMGITFSMEEQNLTDWKVERLFLFH